eukprot:s1355_g14.t1
MLGIPHLRDEKSALKTPTAGYPRPRLVVPNTCPWPMARSPTPCLQAATRKLAPSAVAATPPSATTLPLAAVVAPEALHVTTRLPRHSLTSTEQHTLIATRTTDLDAVLTPTRSLGSLGTPTHSPSAQVRHCTPEPRDTRRSSPIAAAVAPLASPTQRTRSPARQVLVPGAVTVVAPPAIPGMANTPVPPLPLAQAPAETVPVPLATGAATVVAPAADPIKAEKMQGSGPVIITVPSTKMLRPVGSRATVPMAGYCTPKEPMSPPRSMPRARIQVMPPATPPRQNHRVVMPLGAGVPAQPVRPQSLLRAATSARSVEMLSPKDPQTPHLPMSQSLLVPSTRTASPGRGPSPVRRMLPTWSQRTLHTQPALSVSTPMTAPRSPLGIESRHLQSRSARPQLHQWGVPPEKWGIHFDQLLELEQHQKFQRDWNTREVVSEIIWPETAGKGIGRYSKFSPVRLIKPGICVFGFCATVRSPTMMKVQKQNTNSSCSTPSDFRKQSWAELSEDLLTDSEPGAWESERYTDLESSPQTSPMQSPVQSPAMAKNDGAMSGAASGGRSV